MLDLSHYSKLTAFKSILENIFCIGHSTGFILRKKLISVGELKTWRRKKNQKEFNNFPILFNASLLTG